MGGRVDRGRGALRYLGDVSPIRSGCAVTEHSGRSALSIVLAYNCCGGRQSPDTLSAIFPAVHAPMPAWPPPCGKFVAECIDIASWQYSEHPIPVLANDRKVLGAVDEQR